jgi:hypothetical protein
MWRVCPPRNPEDVEELNTPITESSPDFQEFLECFPDEWPENVLAASFGEAENTSDIPAMDTEPF